MKVCFADGLPALPTSIRRAAGLPTHGFCGGIIVDNQWTSIVRAVSCYACLNALLAHAQRTLSDIEDRMSAMRELAGS